MATLDLPHYTIPDIFVNSRSHQAIERVCALTRQIWRVRQSLAFRIAYEPPWLRIEREIRIANVWGDRIRVGRVSIGVLLVAVQPGAQPVSQPRRLGRPAAGDGGNRPR